MQLEEPGHTAFVHPMKGHTAFPSAVQKGSPGGTHGWLHTSAPEVPAQQALQKWLVAGPLQVLTHPIGCFPAGASIQSKSKQVGWPAWAFFSASAPFQQKAGSSPSDWVGPFRIEAQLPPFWVIMLALEAFVLVEGRQLRAERERERERGQTVECKH